VKAQHHSPLRGETVELLLTDAYRNVRWVNSPRELEGGLPVNGDCAGSRVLGWRPPGGALRHGEYDVVDPALADL
jgi:hypothetical protein